MNALHFKPAELASVGDEELMHAVVEHKYLINQTIPFEVSMEDAFESWNLLVAAPLNEAIAEVGLDRAFPEASKGELFHWVCDHWHFMKKDDTVDVSVQDAVLDYGSKYAPKVISRFEFFLRKIAA